MANVMRYSYLRGPGGRFRNLFDHGARKNCSDFLINGYNEDVERIEESAHDEEIGMVQMGSNPNMQNGLVHPHQTNGNGHIAINVDPKSSDTGHGHSHSHSQCSHGRTSGAPLGLGLGLGLGRSSSRSVTAL